jgi:hypothetical protein
LVEALRVLRRMPMNGQPREFGNSWPRFAVEYRDLAQYADDPVWKAEQAAERNRVVIRPSALEIGRMEAAIVWPARYLLELPQCLRVVQAVAVVRSHHGDISRAVRRLKLPGRMVRRWNRQGLDAIAAGLRRDEVPVF